MVNYVTLVNQLLVRINEVTLDIAGDGFGTARNVQALAKEAINSSIRLILQDTQEWPFLKTTYTQALTADVRTYNFPADMATVDWDTFYIKRLSSVSNHPGPLKPISFEEYTQSRRSSDDLGNKGAPNTVYQTFGSEFGLTPVPNDVYEVEYRYWSFPSDLVLYDDTSIVPDRFNHVVIEGAMMFLMRFRSNEQSASTHQQNFEDGIKAMRRVLLDDILHIRSTAINRSSIGSTSGGLY